LDEDTAIWNKEVVTDRLLFKNGKSETIAKLLRELRVSDGWTSFGTSNFIEDLKSSV